MSKCFVHLSNFLNNLLINIVIYLFRKCLIIVIKTLLLQPMNLILSDILLNKIKTLKTKRKHIHESWKSAIYMYLASFSPRRFKLVLIYHWHHTLQMISVT